MGRGSLVSSRKKKEKTRCAAKTACVRALLHDCARNSPGHCAHSASSLTHLCSSHAAPAFALPPLPPSQGLLLSPRGQPVQPSVHCQRVKSTQRSLTGPSKRVLRANAASKGHVCALESNSLLRPRLETNLPKHRKLCSSAFMGLQNAPDTNESPPAPSMKPITSTTCSKSVPSCPESRHKLLRPIFLERNLIQYMLISRGRIYGEPRRYLIPWRTLRPLPKRTGG